MNSGSRIRLLVRVVAIILCVAVIAGLVSALRRDGPAAVAAWRSADVKPGWIVIACLLGLLGHAVLVVGWQRLLGDCGVAVGFWQTARMFLASNLGRYLPAGKAWQMGIVAVMATEANLPASIIAATSLFLGVVGVAVGAILLSFTGSTLLGVSPAWSLVPVFGVAVLIALPQLLRAVPRVRAALLRKIPALEFVTNRTMWVLVWTTGLSWIAWGLALYALAAAMLAEPAASAVACIAAWIASFIAGLVAIVAPAGLGVREELMRTMLTSAGLSAGGALIVVVVSRVWTALLEIIPALIVLAFRRTQARATIASQS